jgi:rhodanese-related sulfurtransferase
MPIEDVVCFPIRFRLARCKWIRPRRPVAGHAPMRKAMRGNNWILISTLSVILGSLAVSDQAAVSAAAAGEFKTAQAGGQTSVKFTTLTSAQLAEMLPRKDFYLVNVHTPYDGEIRDTDAFIVYDKIAENLDKLPRNKNEKIVLYCQSGRMSEIAAQELSRLGYSRVSHLAGGMIDWKRNGHEVIKK